MAEYAITYHGNGGEGIPENQVKVTDIDLILSDAVPTKTGYGFGGWSLKNNTVADYQPGSRYTRNLPADLYAIWNPKIYGIYYDANGGIDAPATQGQYHGVGAILSKDIPTRGGYNFKGWATSRTGQVAYLPGDTYSENVARYLYAIWEEKQMGFLVPGQDCNGRELRLSIPDGTVTSTKVIAKASSTNQIREQVADGVSTGIVQALINGELVETVFYRTGSDPVNLSSLTLPEDFGTILEVDDTAVLYPYIKREIHKKNYLVTEDLGLKEGVTKEEYNAFSNRVQDNLQIQHGVITGSIVLASNDYTDVVVNFSKSFPYRPIVIPVLVLPTAAAYADPTYGGVLATVLTVETYRAIIRILNSTDATKVVYLSWLALLA